MSNCECTDFSGDVYQNPLCQAPTGAFGQTQYFAHAYPSVRQLQALHDHGARSVVASICARQVTDDAASDFGYHAAFSALVDRFSDVLSSNPR